MVPIIDASLCIHRHHQSLWPIMRRTRTVYLENIYGRSASRNYLDECEVLKSVSRAASSSSSSPWCVFYFFATHTHTHAMGAFARGQSVTNGRNLYYVSGRFFGPRRWGVGVEVAADKLGPETRGRFGAAQTVWRRNNCARLLVLGVYNLRVKFAGAGRWRHSPKLSTQIRRRSVCKYYIRGKQRENGKQASTRCSYVLTGM